MTPDALRRLAGVSDQMLLRDLAVLGRLMAEDAKLAADDAALIERLTHETASAGTSLMEAQAVEAFARATSIKRKGIVDSRAALAQRIAAARAGARRAHGRAGAIDHLLKKALAERAAKRARREEQTLAAVAATKAAARRREDDRLPTG